jgi:serine protease Do
LALSFETVKARTLLLPAFLCQTLALSVAAYAAPPDSGAKPAAPSAAPAAKPTTPPTSAAPAPKPAAPSSTAVAPKPTPSTPLAATPGALSTAPAAAAGAATPASKPEAKLPAPKNPIEAALLGVVRLERAGKPIGIGTLLSGDGRILTALSPLTHGNQIDARYPEGQVIHVKISYSDRAWDLALLTPEGDARHAGLKASQEPSPNAGNKLHAIGYVNGKVGSSDLTVKARGTLRGGDSAELSDALELSLTPKPIDIGGPLVDDRGEVVAVVARACSPVDKAGCTLVPYAAPVSAIRSFLRGVPVRRGPWLGLEVVAFDAGVAHGVRVAALAFEGPASSAGLRAGPPGVADVVLAVDGAPVSTAEAFSDAVELHTPGTPVRLLLLTDGRYREVSVVAREAPNVGAAVRHDRMIQSNPMRPWPRGIRQESTPNPYR